MDKKSNVYCTSGICGRTGDLTAACAGRGCCSLRMRLPHVRGPDRGRRRRGSTFRQPPLPFAKHGLDGDNCRRDVREHNGGQTATLHETTRRRSDTSGQLSYTAWLTAMMTRRCGPNPRAMSHRAANIRLKHIPVCVRRWSSQLVLCLRDTACP